MIRPGIVFTLLMFLNIVTVAIAKADEEAGPALSFGNLDAYQSVNNTIENLTSWALGEFAEHQNEGLFKRYADDGDVITATIALVSELKQLAKKAKAKGDIAKARAYLLSAEATARYATQMPHLLEERVKH